MTNRPSTMAADDLTGPPVLKLQRSDNLSGKVPAATPVSAGLPRNIGQLAPLALLLPASEPSDTTAGQRTTRMVAAAAKIQRLGWSNFIRNALCKSSARRGNRRPPEGSSSGGSIPQETLFGNPIIPIRIICILSVVRCPLSVAKIPCKNVLFAA